MKHLATINLENVLDVATSDFRKRTAARAVILDDEGNIAMLAVTKHGYHKLPGGGIDEGEEILDALSRECLEEVGCAIEVLSELGTITEIRKTEALHQESFAYLARLVGEKGTPNYTESELSRGFEVRWMPLKEAKRRLQEEKLEEISAQYMTTRDLRILEEAELSLAS